MQVLENVSLRQYNTFGMNVHARWMGRFSDLQTLQELLQHPAATAGSRLILGGGSNLLFTHDVDGLVLKNEVPGIIVLEETAQHVYLRVGAGENWHAFTNYCVNKGWGGVENLSLIPGSVGAAPIQNIGAYGVELKDCVQQVEAYHLQEQAVICFSNTACAFGYRDSVFKNKYRNQLVILNVTFCLSKQPVVHTGYGAIAKELEAMGVQSPGIKEVAAAVIRIRRSKLPDPARLGNAGSFFKNPAVSRQQYEQLHHQFPQLVAYPNADGTMKLAAGWLIEQCGWKGYRRGDAGCHEQQALVLVNHGAATGEEIVQLSHDIRQSVIQKFGVVLEPEVNIL